MEEYTERGQNIWKELVWKESRATMCDLLSDMSETSLFDFTTKSIKSDKLAWTKIYSQTISHLGLAAKTQPLPTNTNRVSRILSSYTFVVIMKLIYCSSTISRQGQREVRSKPNEPAQASSATATAAKTERSSTAKKAAAEEGTGSQSFRKRAATKAWSRREAERNLPGFKSSLKFYIKCLSMRLPFSLNISFYSTPL